MTVNCSVCAQPMPAELLCANHHYELTLTGASAGTEITQ